MEGGCAERKGYHRVGLWGMQGDLTAETDLDMAETLRGLGEESVSTQGGTSQLDSTAVS